MSDHDEVPRTPPPPFDDPTTARAGSAPPPETSAGPQQLGDYTIVRVLGEGGMGTVYEAEQRSPRRAVALKVIRAGGLSREMLRRFEFESQVLGRLQHPGIAQVYEAGVLTPTAGAAPIPFFAMEFVRGASLTEYADRHELGTRGRLELIAKVADAVHHAHLKGVIHRDLKPANILVTEDGQPKVLDFGVARATDSDLQHATMRTDVGQIVGTIPYMSPEQTSGDSSELDTRSDVYALGVITYELLAGKLPYDLHRKMPLEALRTIRESEPTRLSTLDRTLRGDVETIVGRALEKEKDRRYQSAEAFAADIRRYLRDEPIAARPASAWYQSVKFVRRHRGLVTGLAVAFALLVVGLVGTLLGLREAVAARHSADQRRDEAVAARESEVRQRQAAEQQRDKAKQIVEFLSELLRGVRPAAALGRDTTMLREMMDGAAARLDLGTLANSPEAEVTLRRTIGTVYADLGEFERAQPMLDAALDRARHLPNGDDAHEAVRVQLDRAKLALRTGRPDEAEALGAEALARARATSPSDEVLLGLALSTAGETALLREDLAASERFFREAAELYQRVSGPDHAATALANTNLAIVLHRLGRWAEAEQLGRAALRGTRANFPPGSLEVASVASNLATGLQNLRKYEEADALFQEALTIRRRVFPPGHQVMAQALFNLGFVKVRRGENDAATALLDEAIRAYEQLDGPDCNAVLKCRATLARVERTYDPAKAERTLVAVIAAQRRANPTGDFDLTVSLQDLGDLLERRGDVAGAANLYREAMPILDRILPPEHVSVIGCRQSYATFCWRLGRYEVSIPMLEDVFQRMVTAYGRDDPRTQDQLVNLGVNHRDAGHPAEAIPKLEEARASAARHPQLRWCEPPLLACYVATGQMDKAAALAREMAAAIRSTTPDDSDERAQSLLVLGTHAYTAAAWSSAEEVLREAERTYANRPTSWQRGYTRSLLGGAIGWQGRFAEAEPLLLAAYEELVAVQDQTPAAQLAILPTSAERVADLYDRWEAAEPGRGHGKKVAGWLERAESR